MSDPVVLGYSAVIIPSRLQWHGFRVVESPAIDADADRNLDAIIKLHGQQQGSTVYRQVDGVESAATNAVIGSAAAVLVEHVMARRDLYTIAVFTRLLHRLSGFDYFYVVGSPERNGTRTRFAALPATDEDSAKRLIQALPEVAVIDAQRLLRGLQKGEYPRAPGPTPAPLAG